ncbi:peptidylprolyl isomerase [Psychroserpens sp.]|uniref:peptidylprolyl isomerase n=1 Tax=Psychroserpens sp. TaxID=2020870 RepID=UPI001B09254B|nr:peptidylprolyl isomerase [Psychroserpens sp.]MBO6631981.1 peptidylprolyl isomerase [Psychroserpens sp.]MBO6654374.1 peptidylprolyl isomerase [Psychroserpens sp.]MBO6682340.1 peptidylprolyl isomerase [Psychroserpens sp.]MBO6751000.1 peptidylprolyl isomerase [Psychroserpens sp.]
MQLKTNNLKSTIKTIVVLFVIGVLGSNLNAQEIIPDEVDTAKKQVDSTQNGRKKVDGVAAVIGDFVVLDSDIDKEYIQLQARGVSIRDITRCQLFGKLLEDKLYAHHAIQDSIQVNELEIRSNIEQQISAFLEQKGGSMQEILDFYNKDSEQALREEMFEINKNAKLAGDMQRKIIEDVEVTPEEVREYFNSIPKDERPVFGTELKVAQIVVIPEVTEEAKQAVIDRLREFKADVQENGASFTTKAVFYSDDTAARSKGGAYTLNRKRPQMVKEFRDVAFSLQEGEISEPFETDFGYHIILLEKIRGQEYDIRHILLRPEITDDAITAAQEEITKVRERIVAGDLTFADAAREFSDEEETKFEGGQLINPYTQDSSMELTKMDPELYGQIQDLKDNEISLVLRDQDRINPIKFKILTVTDRIDEHEADFARDYLKIKNLALQDKQFKEIAKWQEEKIFDTYVKINDDYKSCEFNNNWLKNEKQ